MPRIVEKDKKRAEIARAAIEVFARKGFEKSTISEIAVKAGIGKGTFYEYFRSKEEILIQVTRELFAGFDQAIGNDLMAITDPRKRLIVLIQESMSLMMPMSAENNILTVFVEIWLLNMRGELIELKNLFNGFLNQYRHLCAGIIQEGQDHGQFRADMDPELSAYYLIASLDGLGVHFMMNPDAMDIPARLDEFIEQFLRSIQVSEK